jgi:hypothetical protein
MDDLLLYHLDYSSLLLRGYAWGSNIVLHLSLVSDYHLLGAHFDHRLHRTQLVESYCYSAIYCRYYLLRLRRTRYCLCMYRPLIRSLCHSVNLLDSELFHSNHCLRHARLHSHVRLDSPVQHLALIQKRPQKGKRRLRVLLVCLLHLFPVLALYWHCRLSGHYFRRHPCAVLLVEWNRQINSNDSKFTVCTGPQLLSLTLRRILASISLQQVHWMRLRVNDCQRDSTYIIQH